MIIQWDHLLPELPDITVYIEALENRILGERIANIQQLYGAAHDVLLEWINRLRDEARGELPEKVTAFRPEMAVHGKFREPCPVCSSPVQRIRFADNETNYCARCQTGGRILSDRSLARLLKDDWPKRLEDLAKVMNTQFRRVNLFGLERRI